MLFPSTPKDLYFFKAKIESGRLYKSFLSKAKIFKFFSLPIEFGNLNNSLFFNFSSSKFEKARLQYTRIGLPVYDLVKLFEVENMKGIKNVEMKIIEWITSEFKAVDDLIKSYS